MKLRNEVNHKVTVENENGEKVLFVIDATDMVQLAKIGKVFKIYDEMTKIQIKESDDFDELMFMIEKVSDKLVELNRMLDLAFGEDITKKAFMNSSSLVMYNDFFEQLSGELDKAGVKVNDYISQIRKDRLVQDHKKPGDTI